MNTEQERAAFEAWFTKIKAYISDPKDIFAQIVRDIAWEAWQAAIEADRKRGGANPTTAGNDVESDISTGSQDSTHLASFYSGCGCNSEDCRVNGCLIKRQAQSATAPGGGGMPAEPAKSYLKVSYDKYGDCLYVVCDSNEPALSDEDEKGILYRYAESDGRLVGITIMNFMGRHAKSPDDAPQPAEPMKRKRPYAPGSALGELGVIPMCDQVDEPVKVPPGYVLIAEKHLEEMIGPERMEQLAKREL